MHSLFNKRFYQLSLSSIFLVCFSVSSQAAIVVDQENLIGPGGVNYTLDWYQSFTPSYNNITGASMSFDFNSPGTATIRLFDSIGGTELASGTATGNGLVSVDFGGPVAVVPEQEYFLKLEGSYQWEFSPDNPYSRGQLWLCNPECTAQSGGNADAIFQTFADDSTIVPIPAAVWLFGSGLFGLLGIARRKQSWSLVS